MSRAQCRCGARSGGQLQEREDWASGWSEPAARWPIAEGIPDGRRLRRLNFQNCHRGGLRVNLPLLRRLAREALAEMPEVVSYEVGLRLVDAAQIAAANRRYLGRTGPTDVIAFDYTPSAPPGGEVPPAMPRARLHGDLMICLDTAQEQARRFRTSWGAEVARYLVHGLLHLRGYDDRQTALRRVMKQEEDRLLRRLARRLPLRGLVLEARVKR